MCNPNVNLSYFYCTKCGREGIPVFRKKGQLRSGGHLKNLYCIYCGEENNFVEITGKGTYTKEKFLKEFELGRYVNGKRIPIQNLTSCKNQECKYCIDGKCWNATGTVECEVRKNG